MTVKVVKSFKDLDVWKKAMQLACAIHVHTRKFPKEELYGMVSQMRRAAVSIPSNISEGHARGSSKEYLNFVSIARGSCAELETQIYLCDDFGYIHKEDIDKLLHLLSEVSRMLGGLHTSVKKKVSGTA